MYFTILLVKCQAKSKFFFNFLLPLLFLYVIITIAIYVVTHKERADNMEENEMRKVFADNLKYFLKLNGKQPVDLVRDLGINFSTLSSWMTERKMPRIGKVELLANYFGVKQSDLLEEMEDSKKEEYITTEMQNIIKMVDNRPSLKKLLYICNELTDRQIQNINNMIVDFQKKEM